MDLQLVGVLIGGLIALVSVIAVALLHQRFQRRRDAKAHTWQLAENKRAQLTGTYEALMLTAQEFFDKATRFSEYPARYRPGVYVHLSNPGPEKEFWETQAFREAKDASSQFVNAYVPFFLETDDVAILGHCMEMHDAWATYLEQIERHDARLDQVKFNNAYHALTQELRSRKSAVENIP